ncbi:MAG: polysaccharide deacetylase family protein [Oscillospiraceae bacterium]|jgi:peptidoglycan-N-acetylmuramic acid deacetylase|nr:polysaccharide deacetylase family protein [Oscillospiraceae bacterium]
MKIFVTSAKQIITVGLCLIFAVSTLLISLYFSPQNNASSAPKHLNSSKSWGLCFRKKNTKPDINENEEVLRKYNVYFVGNGKNKVYLTFDLGYENGFTDSILDVLKKHNIKAAFFPTGYYIKNNSDIIKRICNEGHIVGNHTYNHPDMSQKTDIESFKKELDLVENEYKKITGNNMPKYYRPPMGKYSEINFKFAQQLGFKTIFWGVAHLDWNNKKQPDCKEVIKKLTERIYPGAIILLHGISETNSKILDKLVSSWEKEGYVFDTLENLD